MALFFVFLVLKAKSMEPAQKRNIGNFQASDDWLDHWRKECNEVSLKKIDGEGDTCSGEMVTSSGETTLQLSCPNMSSDRSTTPTNVVVKYAGTWFTFKPKLKQKIHPEKMPYISGNGTFSLIFFLYFRKELSELKKLKKTSLKNSLYFGKWNFLASKNLIKRF